MSVCWRPIFADPGLQTNQSELLMKRWANLRLLLKHIYLNQSVNLQNQHFKLPSFLPWLALQSPTCLFGYTEVAAYGQTWFIVLYIQNMRESQMDGVTWRRVSTCFFLSQLCDSPCIHRTIWYASKLALHSLTQIETETFLETCDELVRLLLSHLLLLFNQSGFFFHLYDVLFIQAHIPK